ncbi:MAG: DUF134 domain-containing protein [Patescibacteria group bacterium]|nr:DUF134 domain-containing protein [Patescibacteria group bacterium]
MARPRLKRRVQFTPKATSFKPDVPGEGFFDYIELTLEEAEAIRLKNVEGLDQIPAARAMRTSQATFHRILKSAYRKIGDAIVHGRVIKIR